MRDPAFTLFLARHGETEHNRLRLMQGRSVDADLNQRGRLQADLLAERFASESLNAVYASGLKRARQTAERVAARHGLSIQTLESVAEMSWGDLEGRSIDEVGPYLSRVTKEWSRGEFGTRVGGGETILDVELRAKEALQTLRSRHGQGDQVLVITHGRFLRVLLATAIPGAGLENMDQYGHSNTGVYRLDWTEGGIELSLRNSTEHLASLEAATHE